MKTIQINDLACDIELDRQAMRELLGCGLWGSIKKYTRKGSRYVKREVKRKINTYKEVYDTARSLPGDLYRMRGTFYRAARSGFGIW